MSPRFWALRICSRKVVLALTAHARWRPPFSFAISLQKDTKRYETVRSAPKTVGASGYY